MLPPPHLLRALIATARHGSVVRASEELHVTASAVSKQLTELESTFGLTLFERVRNRLLLTGGGRRYVERIGPLLDEIERVTLDLLAEGRGNGAAERQELHLSMLPTIGAKWLIPRLPDFLAKHPHIDLGFVPFADGYDFSHPALDCAIRYGKGEWGGARAHYLVGHEVVVIAPPGAVARLQTPGDVRPFRLLHHATEPSAWARWCVVNRVVGADVTSGPRFDQVSSQVQAVIAGMGVALVPRCLVEHEVQLGVVAEAPFPAFAQETGYYLCYPEEKAGMPALQAFRDWALARAAAASY